MRPRGLVLVVLPVLALSGCQSTQDKSAALARESKEIATETGLQIKTASKVVEVTAPTVISDENGTAVALELTNTGSEPLKDVPIAIDVKGADGESVFKNDAPGAAKALVSAPLLLPGKPTLWVHDQIATRGGTSVDVVVGDAPAASGTIPAVKVGESKVEDDPSSGPTVLSDVTVAAGAKEQSEMTVFSVVRNAGKVVAAGRAVVPRARPGRKVPFSILYIGDPRKGDVTVEAQPTVLG